MKEIKVRFWDEVNKRFWYGGQEGESIGKETFQSYFKENKLTGVMLEDVSYGFKAVDDTWERDLPSSLYTGMEDVNGTEIFEGDIVKYTARNLSQAFGDKDAPAFTEEKRVIRFHNYSFNVPQGFVKEIEVIGNVYENPELLGKRE